MTDVVKVKPKKNFEWEQDPKSIRVTVNMPDHKSIKNVQVFLSDLVLRITSKQKKTSHILDFDQEIDYLSPENKFTLIDGKIIANLKKKNPNEDWERLLVEDLSLAQLKERRKQSQTRYQANIKQVEENKEKLKIQYDRMATRQIMRFQEEERNVLEGKKKRQKEQALNEVFRNVNETTGKIQYEEQKWNKKGEQALKAIEKEQQQEKKRIQQKKKQQKQAKFSGEQKKTQKTQNTGMFTEEDVEKFDQMRNQLQEEIEEIPVRKGGKVNLKFTQKLYPNVATRDYHYTEPPLPKGSVPLPPSQGDLENKNPLWLKDKGDGFIRDKNYGSAIEAYNQALKIDPKHIKSLMNRSLAHLKMFNLDACMNDCDVALAQMQTQLTNNQENNDESLLDVVKLKTRKAICMSWKGKLKEAKQILEEQLSIQYLPDHVVRELKLCVEAISRREQSLKIKLKGDEKVKRNNYKEAIKHYDEAIGIDSNEYALSNKCLCLNKQNEHTESMEAAEIGLKKLSEFGLASNKEGIVLKLLYRKAKAQEGNNLIKEAEETLKKGLSICPQDKDFKTTLKEIKSRYTIEQLKQKKIEAAELLKSNDAEGALAIYTKCVKMLENSEQTLDYLSILQNQCVCYLKLKQYDSIISVSLRILKLVNSLKNKIVEFGTKKNSIDRSELDKIAVRTLMRRANAYVITGQIYNAKSDLQKAMELDPQDPNVQKQLQKIKNSL